MMGLPGAFFLIYLVSKSLLLWGMIRLVQTLVPNRPAATLAPMYCMAMTLHYGGQHVLNLQESFATPRLLASGLVLIGLDLLLRGRAVFSGLVIAAALAIHPLMAFGGLLIWSAFLVWKYFGTRAFLGVSAGAVLLAALILAVEPVGLRCFGAMDESWRESIMHASSFNFPSQWLTKDWYYLAIQPVILGVAIGKYRTLDADKARLLIVLMLVTVAGTAVRCWPSGFLTPFCSRANPTAYCGCSRSYTWRSLSGSASNGLRKHPGPVNWRGAPCWRICAASTPCRMNCSSPPFSCRL